MMAKELMALPSKQEEAFLAHHTALLRMVPKCRMKSQ